MQTTFADDTRPTPTRNHFRGTSVATEPRGSAKLRKVLFGAALVAVPAVLGTAVGLLARSRRAGIVAGGATALGLGVVRWQLERTFNDEPDYVVEERIGDLEIRRYDARVEAETLVADESFEASIEAGFDRLAKYIFGENSEREKLGMTTPVTSKLVDDGDRRIAFIMPISRTIASLPAPTDDRIELVEVPARRVAVLCFRGRRNGKMVAKKEAELRRLVAEAGLAAKGEPVYAGFDPPWTLPLIRRNEVAIAIV